MFDRESRAVAALPSGAVTAATGRMRKRRAPVYSIRAMTPPDQRNSPPRISGRPFTTMSGVDRNLFRGVRILRIISTEEMEMKKYSTVAVSLVFALGVAVGISMAKGFDTSLYRGKEKKEAARALLDLARKQAGKGSWERIGVGRVYYLGGMKSEGQAIFDEVTARKPEPTDWWRIGRVYWEVGEWEKAHLTFEKSLVMNPKDDKGLAELGAYYLIKGDRAKAEELFDRSVAIESGEVWNTAMVAGGYLGVKPQE